MINLIHIATSITWAHFHYSFIANFKVLSICISIGYSWTFEDTIAEPRDEYKSLCTGTYFIAIYCRNSLDFIIGYFKTFSNAIFNFDSYGISIYFSDDNSKTSISSIVWLYSHDSFIANSKTFSIVITIINSKTFSDSVAWFYTDCESLCMGTSLYDSTPL